MKRLFPFVFVIILLSGCGRENNLTPKDTIVGSRQRSNDFIFESEIYDSLPARDGQFNYNASDILASVHFDFDQSSLPFAERARLDAVANTLKMQKDAKILLIGHCDWFGTEEYNMGLGERRANTVANYLNKVGLGKSHLNTVSRGSLDATKGLKKETASQDRRADIVLISE